VKLKAAGKVSIGMETVSSLRVRAGGGGHAIGLSSPSGWLVLAFDFR
jgi:hypothetical protein